MRDGALSPRSQGNRKPGATHTLAALLALAMVPITALSGCSLGDLGGVTTTSGPGAPLPAVILTSVTQSPQGSVGYETLHIEALNPADGSARWRYQALSNPLRSHRALAIANGVIYLTTDDPLPATVTTTTPLTSELTALSERDGHTLWKVQFNGLGAEPVVSGGVVYANNENVNSAQQVVNSFYALDAITGKQLWRADVTDIHTSDANLDQGFGTANSIQIADGVEYVTSNTYCATTCSAQYLLALRTSDGKQLWKKTVYTSNTIQQPLTFAGSTLYTWVAGAYNAATDTTGPAELLAINTSDGATRWETPISVDGPLTVVGGLIYVVALSQDEPNTPDSTWTSRVVALDAGSGATRWRYTAATGERNAPAALLAVSANAVYAQSTATVNGATAYRLLNLDPASGAIRWQTPLTQALGVAYLDSDTLYAVTNLVEEPNPPPTSLLALSASDGHSLWSTRLPAASGNNLITFLTSDSDALYATYYTNTLSAISSQGSHATRWQVTPPGALVDVTLVA